MLRDCFTEFVHAVGAIQCEQYRQIACEQGKFGLLLYPVGTVLCIPELCLYQTKNAFLSKAELYETLNRQMQHVKRCFPLSNHIYSDRFRGALSLQFLPYPLHLQPQRTVSGSLLPDEVQIHFPYLGKKLPASCLWYASLPVH